MTKLLFRERTKFIFILKIFFLEVLEVIGFETTSTIDTYQSPHRSSNEYHHGARH